MNSHIKKFTAITILASFFSLNVCFANSLPEQYSDDIAQQLEQILQDQPSEKTEDYAYLKTGENLTIELLDEINSESSDVGEAIRAKLILPIELDNQIIAPEGSIVSGKISQISKAGGWYNNAVAEVIFEQIQCNEDYKLPIIAKIVTKDASGLLVGGDASARVVKIFQTLAMTSLGGAVVGFGFGLLTPYVLAGAAVGFGVGAFIGAGWLFSQKGKPVDIPSGTKLIIKLEHDVAVGSFEL